MSCLQKLMSIRLLNDSFWSIFGNVLSKGLALLGGIIVARFLGKDIYGEYGILKNTITTIAIFSTFGLGYTSTKIIAELYSKKSEFIREYINAFKLITLILGGFVSLLVFVFSSYISNNLFGVDNLSLLLKYISILVLVNALISVQLGALSGLGVFKHIAKFDIFVGVFFFIFTIIFTYFFGIEGAILSLILTQILNLILYEKIISKHLNKHINKRLTKDEYKKILTFSLPIALQEGVYSFSQWLISILLLNYANFGDVGMYTAAMQWNSIILFIPGVLRNVILSNLSNNNNDERSHSKMLKQILFLTLIVVLFFVIVVFVLSNLISSFYGNTFVGLEIVIRLSVVSTIFISLSNVYAQAYMSKNLNWIMFAFRAIRDIGTIVLFLILMKYTDSAAVIVMLQSIVIVSAVFFLIMMLFYSYKSGVKSSHNICV